MGKWLERHRTYIASVPILATVVLALYLWIGRPQPEPFIISTPVPTATPILAPTPTPAPLRVYVTGAVHKPDVYVLPPGSIVKDALLAAGGATDDADLERINLAVQVYDQQQIYVPRVGEDAPPIPLPGDRSSTAPLSSKVNINSASMETLDTLPGVGPAIAQRIVDYRTEHGPFATIEEIMNVKGIGPTTFDKMKDMIAVE
jgi:competence protein ComEA